MMKGLKGVYKRRGILGTVAVILLGPPLAIFYYTGKVLVYVGDSMIDGVESL
jgi:hypothetical protein